MKVRLKGIARLALLAGTLASLSGCWQQQVASLIDQQLQDPVIYAMPAEAVRQRLMLTQLPPMVFGDDPPSLTVETQVPAKVTWIVRKSGAEVMRYVAQLGPSEEGGTRIDLSLIGAAAGRFGNVEQKLAQNPTVRSMYLVAMRERIASDLEGREFDLTKVYPALTQATFANMGSIMERFDRAAEGDRRRSRENIDKAYRDEAAGRPY
jgi:hypothetical protein